MPADSLPSPVLARAGASWISRPTPWPRPCRNSSPRPARSTTPRAAASTALTSASTRSAAPPAAAPPPPPPPRPLRARDELVELLLPVGRGAEHERARHVGVVAVDERAEVELHQRSGVQHGVGRPVVRHRGVRPGAHNRLERRAVGAV